MKTAVKPNAEPAGLQSTMPVKFPQVSGRNLRREQLDLPRDFGVGPRIVFIAFQQWQQQQVNSWLPEVQRLTTSFPGLDYVELPVISDRSRLWQLFIDEGMRAGIPNPSSRQRTITLYLDKEEFRSALSLPDEENIYILVVDDDHHVRWQGRGFHSQEQADDLKAAIDVLIISNEP